LHANLKCINNGKKLLDIQEQNLEMMQDRWFKDVMQANELQWLQHAYFYIVDHDKLSAFLKHWKEETSSFHLSIVNMTLKHNDMFCHLRLPIEGRMLDHNISLIRSKIIDLMVELLGSDHGEAKYQLRKTKGASVRFGWLRRDFEKFPQEESNAKEEGDVE